MAYPLFIVQFPNIQQRQFFRVMQLKTLWGSEMRWRRRSSSLLYCDVDQETISIKQAVPFWFRASITVKSNLYYKGLTIKSKMYMYFSKQENWKTQNREENSTHDCWDWTNWITDHLFKLRMRQDSINWRLFIHDDLKQHKNLVKNMAT